jgi:hypothetical protein
MRTAQLLLEALDDVLIPDRDLVNRPNNRFIARCISLNIAEEVHYD